MQKYEQMLEDENVEYEDVKKYVYQFIPKRLYRYREFDNFCENNVAKGEVHFSYPEQYNDPFDCAISFDYKRIIGTLIGNWAEEIYQESQDAQNMFLQHQHGVFDGFRKHVKVACFSEVNDSMLMWSHYAYHHKGYCIEYDTVKSDCFKHLILPVIYKNERYDASKCMLTQNKNIACNPVLYKSKDWEYEHEWRMYGTVEYFNDKPDNLVLKDAISGIYIGARAEEKNEEMIRKMLRKTNVPVYKMKLDDRTYKLLFD